MHILEDITVRTLGGPPCIIRAKRDLSFSSEEKAKNLRKKSISRVTLYETMMNPSPSSDVRVSSGNRPCL